MPSRWARSPPVRAAEKAFASRVWRGANGTIYHVVEGLGRVLSTARLFIFTKDVFIGADWHEGCRFRSSEKTRCYSAFPDKAGSGKPQGAVPRSTLVVGENMTK